MSNLKKTIASGVVGLTLLAGTGYTFATWQSADTVNAGAIQTGTLTISDVQVLSGSRPADFSDVRFVPGQKLDFELIGRANLVGFDIDDVDVTLTSSEFGTIETGKTYTFPGTSNITFRIDQPARIFDDGTTVGARGEIEFVRNEGTPEFNVTSDYDMTKNINLGDLTITLTQK